MNNAFLSYLGLIPNDVFNESVSSIDDLREAEMVLKYRYGIDAELMAQQIEDKYKKTELSLRVVLDEVISKCDFALLCEQDFWDGPSIATKKFAQSGKKDSSIVRKYNYKINVTKIVFLITKAFLQIENSRTGKNYRWINANHLVDDALRYDYGKLPNDLKTMKIERRNAEAYKESFLYDFLQLPEVKKKTVIPFLLPFYKATIFTGNINMYKNCEVQDSIVSGSKAAKLYYEISSDSRTPYIDRCEDEYRLQKSTETNSTILETPDFDSKINEIIEKRIMKEYGQFSKFYKSYIYHYSGMISRKKRVETHLGIEPLPYRKDINDFVTERIYHFHFFRAFESLVFGARNTDYFNRIYNLSMIENVYAIDLYLEMFREKTYVSKSNMITYYYSMNRNDPKDSGRNDDVLDMNLCVFNEFIEYMNSIYYPALYYLFISLIKRLGVTTNDIENFFNLFDHDASPCFSKKEHVYIQTIRQSISLENDDSSDGEKRNSKESPFGVRITSTKPYVCQALYCIKHRYYNSNENYFKGMCKYFISKREPHSSLVSLLDTTKLCVPPSTEAYDFAKMELDRAWEKKQIKYPFEEQSPCKNGKNGKNGNGTN